MERKSHKNEYTSPNREEATKKVAEYQNIHITHRKCQKKASRKYLGYSLSICLAVSYSLCIIKAKRNKRLNEGFRQNLLFPFTLRSVRAICYRNFSISNQLRPKKASVCLFGGTRSMLKLVMFLLRCFYFRFFSISVLVVVFPLLYQVLFIGQASCVLLMPTCYTVKSPFNASEKLPQRPTFISFAIFSVYFRFFPSIQDRCVFCAFHYENITPDDIE